MTKHTINESEKRRAACEAFNLLNLVVADLVVPSRLFEITQTWEKVVPLPSNAIAATRRLILTSLVVTVYRLKELREQLISGWLLTEEELKCLDFPPIDEFIGGSEKWSSFVIVRGQFVGHSFAKKETNRKPGQIIDPNVLGKALRETGLFEAEPFLERIQKELVPGVEKVRSELHQRYPETQQFTKDYLAKLEQSATRLL